MAPHATSGWGGDKPSQPHLAANAAAAAAAADAAVHLAVDGPRARMSVMNLGLLQPSAKAPAIIAIQYPTPTEAASAAAAAAAAASPDRRRQ